MWLIIIKVKCKEHTKHTGVLAKDVPCIDTLTHSYICSSWNVETEKEKKTTSGKSFRVDRGQITNIKALWVNRTYLPISDSLQINIGQNVSAPLNKMAYYNLLPKTIILWQRWLRLWSWTGLFSMQCGGLCFCAFIVCVKTVLFRVFMPVCSIMCVPSPLCVHVLLL